MATEFVTAIRTSEIPAGGVRAVDVRGRRVAVANVGGWSLLDNDNTHTPDVIPAGTQIAVGGYLVLEEAQFVFGLGSEILVVVMLLAFFKHRRWF